MSSIHWFKDPAQFETKWVCVTKQRNCPLKTPDTSHVFLIAKLLYHYKCPSVCHVWGETRFSLFLRYRSDFFLCRFLSSMSIYSVNILSVGLSVRLKGRNLNTETWIYLLLFKIYVWFLFLWRFVWLTSIYCINILSVCLSVRLQKRQM